MAYKEVCVLCNEYGTCSCMLTAEQREARDRPVREAAEAAQRARDEALRQEGRNEGQLQAAAAIIQRLRDRAAQCQRQASIVLAPKSVVRLEGAAMALLDEADVLERAMVTAKEGT